MRAIGDHAHLLHGDSGDFDALMRRIGNARFVLLGEATHGTHEFYDLRAELTKRLILEKGFQAIAIEADWPDAYRVNRYVRGEGSDRNAVEALSGFQRFPQWMWRNGVMVELVEWLRAKGDVGLYGLDLYSMYSSIEEILAILDRHDPAAAARARERYACFEHFSQDTEAYAYSTAAGLRSCEEDAVKQLLEIHSHRIAPVLGIDGAETNFNLLQNARVVRNAEAYYRNMIGGRVNTWNLRDRHMATTLADLEGHLGPESKIVVWAHNSHLGDARATQMATIGEINVGQLVRERWGIEAFSVGFTTYEGTVTAASNWDGPAEKLRVRPGMVGSYELLFHEANIPQFYLLLEELPQLHSPREERAIGVVYRPDTERTSHYFQARLSEQFDAVIHIDHTRAVEPLERVPMIQNVEPAETYPFGV